MKFQKIIVVAFLLFIVALAQYSGVLEWRKPPQLPAAKKVEVRRAPDAVFRALFDDSQLSVADFSGRVILLNFWASWCKPCLEEFPLMFDLIRSGGGRIVLLAVSNDTQQQAARAFVEKMREMNLLTPAHQRAIDDGHIVFAWDPTLEVTQQVFHVLRLPETIVIDRAFNRVRKIVGAEQWHEAETIQSLLQLSDG